MKYLPSERETTIRFSDDKSEGIRCLDTWWGRVAYFTRPSRVAWSSAQTAYTLWKRRDTPKAP